MTPDTVNLIDKVGRDRSEEEELLFLLLLSLLRETRNRTLEAVRLGADPFATARSVLLGNPHLGMPGAANRIARRFVAADVAAYRRTIKVFGDPSEANGYVPVTDYGSRARQAVAKMLGTLQSRLAEALREAAGKGNGATRKAISDAFERGGYVESATSKAWLLASSAVTLTGFAWSGGWFAGWSRPSVAERLKGFRFSAVLDTRTTDVCRACHGTKVPVGSPWLQTRTPPLHFSCRSVLLPIFRDFEASDPPWTPWPMAGFGQAPAISAGIRYVRVA